MLDISVHYSGCWLCVVISGKIKSRLSTDLVVVCIHPSAGRWKIKFECSGHVLPFFSEFKSRSRREFYLLLQMPTKITVVIIQN